MLARSGRLRSPRLAIYGCKMSSTMNAVTLTSSHLHPMLHITDPDGYFLMAGQWEKDWFGY
jgi:hypothetical protein